MSYSYYTGKNRVRKEPYCSNATYLDINDIKVENIELEQLQAFDSLLDVNLNLLNDHSL